MRAKAITGAFLILTASVAHAESAADALFQSLQIPGATATDGATASPTADLKLQDPLSIQLFSAWQAESKLPYDVNGWVQRILRGDHAGAAHQWPAIEAQLPDAFRPTAEAAQLYLLWKLNVPQTFLSQWLEAMGRPSFAGSRASLALDQTIAPTFDRWLVDNVPAVLPEHAAIVDGVDVARGPHFQTLRAWSRLRRGEEANPFLEKLGPAHPLKVQLSQTAALAAIRKGDLGAAAKVFKYHLEPAIRKSGDTKRISTYYLQIARLLYQGGSLDAAEAFYEKIPTGTPEYLSAREELAWVWLRQGKNDKLRGALTTLSSRVVDDKFLPDAYVLLAISNLKFCFYDNVEKNIAGFIASNRRWAREIEKALEATDPPAPSWKDAFSTRHDLAIAKLDEERMRLESFAKESVTAALPAVGQQAHWLGASKRVAAVLEGMRKSRADEYRRQWANSRSVLKEAIRKMQFVKVELMSQVRSLASQGPAVRVASNSTGPAATVQSDAGSQIFPFDGVVWSDELFSLRAQAQARCLQEAKL